MKHKLTLKVMFAKLAVKCKLFRYLNNPTTKRFAAGLCVMHLATQIKLKVGW